MSFSSIDSPGASRPCVSAIIIVFNGARYLREAIESILGQTFEDWELIVADDGSSDNSAAIAQEYSNAHPNKIRVIAHLDGANHGMAATRNLGISHARGRYIGFLDADDIWLPHKLEEQVGLLEENTKAALAYGRTLIWYSWSPAADKQDFFYSLGVRPDTTYEPPVLFQILLDNKAQSPTTCNALMRTELVASVGGFETRFRGMFEDMTFFAPALAIAPAYVSNRHWANYRQHDESCSIISANYGRDYRARFAFLLWLSCKVVGSRVAWRIRRSVWRKLLGAARDLSIHTVTKPLSRS
jgi:glycosyltransferase involved in cell wall biosynthesis